MKQFTSVKNNFKRVVSYVAILWFFLYWTQLVYAQTVIPQKQPVAETKETKTIDKKDKKKDKLEIESITIAPGWDNQVIGNWWPLIVPDNVNAKREEIEKLKQESEAYELCKHITDEKKQKECTKKELKKIQDPCSQFEPGPERTKCKQEIEAKEIEKVCGEKEGEEKDKCIEAEKEKRKVPPLIQEMYDDVAKRYGTWQPVTEEKVIKVKGSKEKEDMIIQPWTPEYAISAIKYTKDAVKDLPLDVKMDYYYSQILGQGLGQYGDDALANMDWDVFRMTSASFYKRIYDVILKLNDLENKQAVSNRLREISNASADYVTMMLASGIFSSIEHRENPGAFGIGWDNKFHWCTINGWCFQLYYWCDKTWPHWIESQQGGRIYLAWDIIGGAGFTYGSTNGRRSYEWWDRTCFRKVGRGNKQSLDDWEIIGIGKKYATIDTERYQFLVDFYKAEYPTNEDALNSRVYLEMGKELHYGIQFLNIVNFMRASKNARWGIWGGMAKGAYHGIKWRHEGINDVIPELTLEEYIADLQVAIKAYWNPTPESSYLGYGKAKSLLQNLWDTSADAYRDIVMMYFLASAWGKFNGAIVQTRGAIFGNAYSMDLKPWTAAELYWVPAEIAFCFTRRDGWSISCKGKGAHNGVIWQRFLLQKKMGANITKAPVKLLNYVLWAGKMESRLIMANTTNQIH